MAVGELHAYPKRDSGGQAAVSRIRDFGGHAPAAVRPLGCRSADCSKEPPRPELACIPIASLHRSWTKVLLLSRLRVPRNLRCQPAKRSLAVKSGPAGPSASEPRSGALEGRAERSYLGSNRRSAVDVHLRSSTESRL